jgi:hypothetical protein
LCFLFCFFCFGSGGGFSECPISMAPVVAPCLGGKKLILEKVRLPCPKMAGLGYARQRPAAVGQGVE